ncbi:TPA: ATP-binding protein, partial [Streptococcus suis]|nr:ATP-binding protein [Streptococcus suis]
MDYYQPMSETDELLDKEYQLLIDRIIQRYNKDCIVVANFPPNFSLMSPYNKIIYRFVEELITNAVKYSKGEKISLLIEVKDDCILLVSENESLPTEHSLGYGLKNITNKLNVLGGKIDILEKELTFRV